MIYNGLKYKNYIECVKKVKIFTNTVLFKTNLFNLIMYKFDKLLKYLKKKIF